jgi:3-hydroxyacyl-CoA dehydrogenase/3a,7a,12a-trihydroxy-5b-cholest-24-enoyl-CoA hydratase
MNLLELVEANIGKQRSPITYRFSRRDTILYALGIGAPYNWLDHDELRFVYELHPDFCALPTMPVTYSAALIEDVLKGEIEGIRFDPMMLALGEQSLEVKKELPVEGEITCIPVIRDIFDKGSGMLIVTDVSCYDQSGDLIALTTSSRFIRGLGNFGGNRGTTAKIELPERDPDAIHEEQTLASQALIYRLSGDVNPLHADPLMANKGNFNRPILHGLATYGYAARAVLRHFGGNQPARFRAMRARFSREVYPGDTLVTEMWSTEDGILLQTKARERDVIVLSNAHVQIT